jgi:hypothetical protein
MGLVNLPNLYASPNDVMDYLGVEGAQLRLDDHLQATGQNVTVYPAAVAQGSTSVNVTPLRSPLLAGDTLEFDGAGMPAVAEVVLSQTAALGSTLLTVNPTPAALNVNSAAKDAGVNTALAQRLVKACQYATSQVKLYCCPRYDDSVLAQCWSCNRWATALAARWLCRRRAQVAPKGVEDDTEEALAEMRQVRAGQMQLEDVGTRTAGWPFMSNATVNLAYDVARVRVEPQISERTPTVYGQYIDWDSALWIEW